VTADGIELLFARHGQTPENAGGRILGRRDPPLSDEGREQARLLAAQAADAGVVAVWTSPLQRARQTAIAVSATVGAEPVVLDDLIESDRGSWEGQKLSHLAEVSPALYAAFEAADPEFVFPGGESLRDQVCRTRRALDVVAGGPAPALVVAHVGTIRAALLAVGQQPPPEREVAHGELIRLRWPSGGGQ